METFYFTPRYIRSNGEFMYPQYRKYPHGRTFFKVIDDQTFMEVNIIGKKYSVQLIEARILPEFNYISDLLENQNGNWLISSEDEFQQMLNFCEKELEKLG